jgi:hypothetical protein
LDARLLTWFAVVTNKSRKVLVVSGYYFKDEAEKLNTVIEGKNTEVSDGFIQRFINRYNIR